MFGAGCMMKARRWVSLAPLVLACAHERRVPGHRSSPELGASNDRPPTTPRVNGAHDDARRVAAIRALAAGETPSWQGLPEGCTRPDVERALSYSPPPAQQSSVA